MITKTCIDGYFRPEWLQCPFEIGVLHQVGIRSQICPQSNISLGLHENRLVPYSSRPNSPGRLIIGATEVSLPSARRSPVGAGKGKSERFSRAHRRSGRK